MEERRTKGRDPASANLPECSLLLLASGDNIITATGTAQRRTCTMSSPAANVEGSHGGEKQKMWRRIIINFKKTNRSDGDTLTWVQSVPKVFCAHFSDRSKAPTIVFSLSLLLPACCCFSIARQGAPAGGSLRGHSQPH